MKSTLRYSLGVISFFFLLAICNSVYASVTLIPDGLNPGDQYRLVFVTAGVMAPASTDILDYNAFVTSQANSSASLSGLGTNWAVIGSTAYVDAMTNTNTNPVSAGVAIYNLSGQLVADDNADLWDGSLDNPINIDQNGNILNRAVFTGTGTNGLAHSSYPLGADGYRVLFGNSGQTDSAWTAIDWSGSGNSFYFYGISDVIEVQGIPEPATLLLLSLGGISISAIRRKRK